MRPAGGQPPLGQDQHQRAEAQRLRQPGIIEPDADACLAQGQAQAQEHQQARQADPVRHPGRDDRREHHRGADEQDQTEIASRHAVSASAHPGGMPVATSLPRSAPPAGPSAPPPYPSRVIDALSSGDADSSLISSSVSPPLIIAGCPLAGPATGAWSGGPGESH